MSFVFGFGMAATVLIGQAFGRKDVDGARRVVGTAIGCFVPRRRRRSRSLGWFVLAGAAAPARDARRRGAARARLSARDLHRHAGDPACLVLLMMALRGAGDAMTPLVVHDRRGGARRGAQPGLHPRPRPGAAARHRRIGDGDRHRQLRRADRRCSSTSTRATCRCGCAGRELRYLRPDRAILKTIVVKGIPMGLQMIVISSSALATDRPRQPRGRRHHRRVRRRDAAVDLSADAGDGARRRGQRDGRAEYRRRQVGPGQRDHARRASSTTLLITGVLVVLLAVADRPALALVPRRRTARRCRSRGISSCSRPGASCCSA